MRVVLADDHRVVRSGLRWMLEPQDDVDIVGEAESGADLLDVLETVEADVVLLDVRMPGVSGLDLLPELRERWPSINVIIMSMHDEPAFIRTAIERGASGYLLKSAGMDEVMAALRAATAGKAYVQPSLTHHLLAEVAAGGATTPTLTDRERELLARAAGGSTTKEMAEELGISEATVKASLQSAFDRLGASSRVEAVAMALRLGLIE